MTTVLPKVLAAIFLISHRFARSEKNIADMSSLGELQCVAGEYISPAATSDPPLDRVPALPVEFVPLRGFFFFFLPFGSTVHDLLLTEVRKNKKTR